MRNKNQAPKKVDISKLKLIKKEDMVPSFKHKSLDMEFLITEGKGYKGQKKSWTIHCPEADFVTRIEEKGITKAAVRHICDISAISYNHGKSIVQKKLKAILDIKEIES